jgi:DNA-binding response OmpR family regulator
MMRPEEMQILLVEVEEPLRRLLEGWLRREKYRVVTASSAEEARAVVRAKRPPLVITDIHLPGRSGMALLRMLKRRYPDTTIILLTARPDVNLAAKAVRWEAFDYLVKPVARVELLSSVRRAERLRQVRHDMRVYTEELERIVQARGDGRSTPAAKPRTWFSLGDVVGHAARGVRDRLREARTSLSVDLPAEAAQTPVDGPGLERALRMLLLRGAAEAAVRGGRSLVLRAGRRGERLILDVEFRAASREDVEEPRSSWAPSPWVRRRIVWRGLSRVSACARALGGRLLVDGSRAGIIRWTLRLPLAEGVELREDKAA